MAIEIEKKFLVVGDYPTENPSQITQGYLSVDPERIVRVRIESRCATIAVKGAKKGIANLEFEYQIPEEDARILLTLTVGNTIEKIRYRCSYGLHTWEIDVFQGVNYGLVVAEIELVSEFQQFDLPEWIGKEVSGDPRYRNAELALNAYELWNNNN